MNKDCLALFEKMSEYLDGELSPELVVFAENHLSVCRDCGENLELMKKSLAIIKSPPSEKIPDGLREVLHSVVREEREKQCR